MMLVCVWGDVWDVGKQHSSLLLLLLLLVNLRYVSVFVVAPFSVSVVWLLIECNFVRA